MSTHSDIGIWAHTMNPNGAEFELIIEPPDPTDGTLIGYLPEPEGFSPDDLIRIVLDPRLIGYIRDMAELNEDFLRHGPREEIGQTTAEWAEAKETLEMVQRFLGLVHETEI